MALRDRVFLRGVAAAYLVMFLSCYVQLPTLFGFDGVQPAAGFLQHVASKLGTQDRGDLFARFPTVLWASDALGVHVDTVMDATALAGAALAGLAAAGVALNTLLFAACWVLYLSLYLVGQTFLSFQWDILLLEVGALAILYAPLRPLSPGAPFRWLVRVLCFKLMFMAGAVKIQARCKSWLSLTALDYHYATQCIPTPLAWYAHQLPPALQAASVAAALVIELPATILLLAPGVVLPTVGVVFQVLLQVLILLTGNYNVFNALTAIMCVPLLPGGIARPSGGASVDAMGPVAWVSDAFGRFEATKAGKAVLLGLTAIGISCSALMFKFDAGVPPDAPWWLRFKPVLAFTVEDFNSVLDVVLLPLICVAFLGLVATCMAHVEDQASQSGAIARRVLRVTWACFVCTASLAVFAASVSPLVAGLRRNLSPSLPPVVHTVSQAASSRHLPVASPYGLFRSMTGMGPDGTDAWGQPVPVVARPEVVLEGSMTGQPHDWHELEISYKPGAVWGVPPVVAPHQPRVAWQMWFAALTSYQGAPWVITLVDQLLEGSLAARRVLDQASYPFGDKPPTFIRASKFEYDFTRVDTAWARRTVAASPYVEDHALNTTAWWVRRHVGEWLPALTKGDATVKTFRDNIGQPRLTASQREAAVAAVQRCRRQEGSVAWLGPLAVDVAWFGHLLCVAAAWCRRHEAVVVAGYGLAVVVIAGGRRRLCGGPGVPAASALPAGGKKLHSD